MSDNKFMFSAKRLDNGEMIQGNVVTNIHGAWIINSLDSNGGLTMPLSRRHGVDPSTIKPLFTTDKPDLWLFENVDKAQFCDLTGDQMRIVIDSMQGEGGQLQTVHAKDEWEDDSPTSAGSDIFDEIYRVRSPGYSLDDVMTDLRNDTKEAGVFCGGAMVVDACFVKSIINKFAKANGLGGNDG